MLIEVYADLICPWCYVGKARLAMALAARPQLRPELLHRPFQLNPDMPQGGLPRRVYLRLKFGSEERFAQVQDTIERTGRSAGIDFAFDRIERTPSTRDGHRLLAFAHPFGLQQALIDRLYRAYFLEGADIGDRDVLLSLAAQVGLPPEPVRHLLETDEGAEAIMRSDRQARHLGVTGVPFFVVDGRYALSGAQPPEVMIEMLDLVGQNSGGEPSLSAPERCEGAVAGS